MKYIDAEKLTTIIEERKAQQDQWINRYHDSINQGVSHELTEILSIIASLQQEQPDGINGVVHHAISAHWIVTDDKQLATALKEFPEGTEVELFIFARKEDEK